MIATITTINEPTASTIALCNKLTNDNSLIVIGDQKGPQTYQLKNSRFYSLKDQLFLSFNIAKKLPLGHYSRKNIGYLLAIQEGDGCIYETDDDNEPNVHWKIREKSSDVVIAEKSSWLNVYKHFSKENIWPRGFLLDRIGSSDIRLQDNNQIQTINAPIQQGLADVSPDVDAIWRMTQNTEFYFERKESIAIPAGSWCPFNTQSTWWWQEAFPLLYLPSYCSFRMTDIWKSFIAQRCLWEMGYMVVFHSAEVDQQRNFHNLMKDFEAEIPGYTKNELFTQTLESTTLLPGTGNALRNLVICYEALISKELLPTREMELVRAWAEDIEKLLYSSNR